MPQAAVDRGPVEASGVFSTCVASCVPTGCDIFVFLDHFERDFSSIMKTKLDGWLEVDSGLRKEKLIHV